MINHNLHFRIVLRNIDKYRVNQYSVIIFITLLSIDIISLTIAKTYLKFTYRIYRLFPFSLHKSVMRVVAIMATSDSTFHATRSSGGMQEKRALASVPYWTLTLVFYMDIYDTRHTCYMPHATAAIDDVPEREMGNIRKSAQLNTNYIYTHTPLPHTRPQSSCGGLSLKRPELSPHASFLRTTLV